MPPTRELSLRCIYGELVEMGEHERAAQVLATLLLVRGFAHMAQGGWELQDHVSCADS